MKISEAWLRDIVGEKLRTVVVQDVLTQLGLEVEGTEPVCNTDLSGLECCLIKEIKIHPKNKNLKVCFIDTLKQQHIEVVCGADNLAVGAKAIFAPVGAFLKKKPVESKEIAGVISNGFLCSAEELGLEERSEGIILLPKDCQLGEDIEQVLELPDNILDIDLTPNRGDCFSAYGIARELNAFFNSSFEPEFQIGIKGSYSQKKISISIEDEVGCPRYSVSLLDEIDNTVILPIKITERLRRAGIKSINPVVDITNYVMLKTGQPLHSFDSEKIANGSIKVRKAYQSEKLDLLNNETVTLDKDSLVIANDNEPLALAGVMGGLSSAVTIETKSVLLESAYFSPRFIARTARNLNLQTDASTRFERGVDPNLYRKASAEAIRLIIALCGGNLVCEEFVSSDKNVPDRRTVMFRPSKVCKIIGVAIPSADIKRILTNLGFEISFSSDDSWEIKIPSFRFDIEIEMDIVEEIVRFYGLEKVPTVLPSIKLKPRKINHALDVERAIRTALSANGFNEIVSYSFVSKSNAEKFADVETLSLQNPISKEMGIMRPTILSSMFPVILYNVVRQVNQMKLFEIGKVFIHKTESVQESTMLTACAYGKISKRHWCQESRNVDFFDVKGDLTSLFQNCFEISLDFEQKCFPGFHPGQSASVTYQGISVGRIGRLHPNIAKKNDLELPLYFFEVDFSVFSLKNNIEYTPISKYPTISRDISIVVEKKITARTCTDEIKKLGILTLKNLELFDVYEGQGIDPSEKSFSLGLIFQSSKGTLTDKEVDNSVDLILQRLEKVLRARLRD